jgi:two-component system OmpR family sensor kinase
MKASKEESLGKTVFPFIIVSGTIGEEMAVAVMLEGAADYLLKDRITRLAPAVRRALQDVVERSERKAAEREIQALNQNLEARVIAPARRVAESVDICLTRSL